MYLEVSPSGRKLRRLKYRFHDKEKRLSLGIYPDVSLKDANERPDTARKLLTHGVDPSEQHKAEKAARAERNANSLEVIARGWYAKYEPNWGAGHPKHILRLLERYILPYVGRVAFTDIEAVQFLKVVQRIEERGTQVTAHRALVTCSQVFRYAIATG